MKLLYILCLIHWTLRFSNFLWIRLYTLHIMSFKYQMLRCQMSRHHMKNTREDSCRKPQNPWHLLYFRVWCTIEQALLFSVSSLGHSSILCILCRKLNSTKGKRCPRVLPSTFSLYVQQCTLLLPKCST